MPILPQADLTAMTTGRDTKALTTSIVRSKTLLWSGYKMCVTMPGLVEVKGQPTEHKTRSGAVRIDPHGPYTVDTRAGTCSCMGFANRGLCAHLPAACEFYAAWERGESPQIRLVRFSKELIALKEIEGERYHVDAQTRRVVVFRDWAEAGAYWEAAGLVEHTELTELTSLKLEELAARRSSEAPHERRYAGLVLQTTDGAQPIPLPELTRSGRQEGLR